MNYGPVYTSDSLKKQLKEMNRDYYGRKTWQELYGNISLSEQQAIGSATQDYASAISQAYESSLQSKQNILSSNLGEGYKEEALYQNEQALEEAFAAYQQNYLSGVSAIEESSNKAKEQVTNTLEKQTEYTKQLLDSPYQYLQYMYENYGDTDLFKEDLWKRYLNQTPIVNEQGEQQYDEQGNPLYDTSLKSWEELVNRGVRDEKTGEWLGFFDDKDYLTIKGQDFYDQMMNQMAYEGRGESFWSWLNKENEELYNWSQTYNPYDYTEQSGNIGSFRTLLGLTSTDEQYKFIERFGGMTETEINNMYNKFNEKVNTITDKINSGKTYKNFESDITPMINELKSFSEQLGISNDIDFTEVEKSVNDYLYKLSNNKSDDVMKVLESTTGTAATLGMTGGIAGSMIPVPGANAIGALSGLVIGTLIGSIGGIIEVNKENKEAQKQYATNVKDTYNNLLIKMIEYSQQKRRQAQIDFYNNNK